jgi:hypothetical protein
VLQVAQFLDHSSDPDELIEMIRSKLDRPGVLSELIMVHVIEADEHSAYDSVRETGVRRESDLAILESLGLVRRVAAEFFIELGGRETEVSVYYHHLTQMGLEFCDVCLRSGMAKLEAKSNANRAKGARRQPQEHL